MLAPWQGMEYEVLPRIDQMQCLVWPEAEAMQNGTALPDMAGWLYSGRSSLNGRDALLWVHTAR